MLRIALLGGGRMGEALVAGLLDADFETDAISVAEIDPERRRVIESDHPGIRVVPSPAWAVPDADVVIVALKPQHVSAALEAAAPALGEHALVLSIAAGITIAELEAAVPGRPVVRAMPNTPALVRRGASAIAAGTHASDADLDQAEQLLGAVGTVVRVPEKMLDAVTGLSGSGPAYVFLLAEAMTEGGVLNGLPRDIAAALVHQTILGAGALLVEGDEGPEALRAAVTSPGGTTAAGLRALEQGSMRNALLDAVSAATERSRRAGSGVTVSKRATHRPPRLDAAPVRRVHRDPRPPSPRSRVVKSKVAGRHDGLGRTEMLSVMRRVVGGDPVALLGLDRFDGVDLDELRAVAADGWGWNLIEPTVTIDPDLLVAGLVAARDRVIDVARRGGRILVATGRPASLLPLHQVFARLARAAGGHLLDSGEAGPLRAAGRASVRLWWLGGVAVLTDGDALLSDPGIEAIDELLFTVPYPDLVVADRGYAGGALRAGIEVVALADLDAIALGLAHRRGFPVTVVPVQERRPASAYTALEPLLAAPPPDEST